nr:hypothetical protein [Tanacetum cinerariifolium]
VLILLVIILLRKSIDDGDDVIGKLRLELSPSLGLGLGIKDIWINAHIKNITKTMSRIIKVDPKVLADPMVDLSTDPVNPNNPADTIVDPTDKSVGPVVGPAVGLVDKPDVGLKYNIDKPSDVGSANKILKSHGMKTIWVQVDPKVPADPMVDLSTDPVNPNNPADTVVDPTDKPVGPVVGPAVGPVDKPDVSLKYNIDKPSDVGSAVGP